MTVWSALFGVFLLFVGFCLGVYAFITGLIHLFDPHGLARQKPPADIKWDGRP